MLHKLLATAALAGTGALVAATATHSATSSPAAPADNVSLLQRYDLTPLLLNVSGTGGPVEPMNGFFGPEGYRIELVTTKVQRDPNQPGLYRVWGKDRFKGHITPFAGTVTLTDVQVRKEHETPNNLTVYTTTGSYELQETAGGPNAGTFQGRVSIDFAVGNTVGLLCWSTSDSPAKGGCVLYDGTWTSATGQVKPATWVADIWSYSGPQVFQNFIIGGRNAHFNPQYAKLGWNNYWRNDEWWASSPRASVKSK